MIGGYTDPDGARVGFGALLLGVHDGDGRLATRAASAPASTRPRCERSARAAEAARAPTASPFAPERPRPRARGAHWVKPELVAEVAFTEWTRDGLLRHPAFQGLREDKPARPDRARDGAARAKPATRAVRSRAAATAPRRSVAGVRAHASRTACSFRDQAITKLELARYYEAVADWMLPHVADRPLSLVRCPEGERGRRASTRSTPRPGCPTQVKRVRIRESGDGTASYLVRRRSAAGSSRSRRSGVLEIHPWGSRVERLEQPDRLVFDLDPAPGLPWARVVEAAADARALLQDLGLVSFVKTTGGKGLHVVVPLAPRGGLGRAARVRARASAPR